MVNQQEFLQQVCYSEQQVSRYLQVRMRKSFTQTVQQRFFVQSSCVMKTATTIQENAEDIYAEAQQINEERAVAEEVVTDVEEADVEEADAKETDVEESFKETETEEA